MRKVLLVVMGIMIAVCISCGKSEKENKPVDVKNSKEEFVEQKISEDAYRTDLTWENLEENILRIRFFLYDAGLQIRFDENNILYTKSQFDKEFLFKGSWKIDKENKKIIIEMKDGKGKSDPYLKGVFKSFSALNNDKGEIHFLLLDKKEEFVKQDIFSKYFSSTDYYILAVDNVR